MLGQAHTPRRRLLPLAAIALAVLAAPSLGLAGGGRSVPALRADGARLAARSQQATLQLYSLDERLATAQAQLDRLDGEAASLQAEQAELAHSLAIVRHGAVRERGQLAASLRLLYEQGGGVEPLEILLGARSLDQALTSIQALERVNDESAAVVRRLSVARRSMLAESALLGRRRASLGAARAEARSTAAALERSQADRRSYIAALGARERLDRREIATVVARARAAQARTAQLAATAPAVELAAPVQQADTPAPLQADTPAPEQPGTPVELLPAAGRTITVTATGYSLPGRTATGLPVGWGVAAVDPSVIPLGTHMTIPGYGTAVAADTGGAVVGATIDLWFPTVAQANAWGRRVVTIVLH